MDDLLRQAYERRERLRRELLAIDGFIAQYEQINSGALGNDPELKLEQHSRGRSRSSRTDLSAMLNAAEAAILKAGRPLSRGSLLRLMESEGFEFAGADKNKVFGTNLWRSGRFRSLKGFGYWPEAHPLPAKFEDAEERGSRIKGLR